MISYIIYAIIAVSILCVVFGLILLLKNDNTYNQQIKVLCAIQKWGNNTGNTSKAIEYMHSMEQYEVTLFRLWDWGCTRIVPKDVYEVIKPYIGQKGGKV